VNLEVITSPDADAHILAVDAWWRANRPAAPNLFREELAHCFGLLLQAPDIGKRYRRHSSLMGIRRVLLRATRYHVYYAPISDVLLVLAVWHSRRGQGPAL
jgi:plasmid stabilization system protein ParE